MLHRLFASIIAGLAVVLTGVSAQTTEELPYGELKICAVPQRLVDYDSNQVSKWLNTMSMFLRCRHDSRFFFAHSFSISQSSFNRFPCSAVTSTSTGKSITVFRENAPFLTLTTEECSARTNVDVVITYRMCNENDLVFNPRPAI